MNLNQEEESSEWREIGSSSEEQSTQVKKEIKSIGNFIKIAKSMISDLFNEVEESNEAELTTCRCFKRFFIVHQVEYVDNIFNLFFQDKSQLNHKKLLHLFDSVIRREIIKNENISLYNIFGKYDENSDKKFIKGVKDNYFLFYILVKKTLESEFNITLNENQSLQIIFVSFPLLISSFE